MRGQAIPDIEARRIPGFRSIELVRRERDHDVEFMTLMWFDNLDSVKAFMGEDYEVSAGTGALRRAESSITIELARIRPSTVSGARRAVQPDSPCPRTRS
jgi:heme-degrading monooxygenase HmoA